MGCRPVFSFAHFRESDAKFSDGKRKLPVLNLAIENETLWRKLWEGNAREEALLFQFVHWNQTVLVRRLLEEGPGPLDRKTASRLLKAQDARGQTVLHRAALSSSHSREAKGGDKSLFDYIVGQHRELGLGVGPKDLKGRTPIILAAEKGKNAAVLALLRAGASLCPPYASASRVSKYTRHYLENCSVEVVEECVARIPSILQGALKWAAKNPDARVAAMLIEKGADVDFGVLGRREDADADIPLYAAARCGNRKVVELLLKKGAPIQDPERKKSALHAAAASGHRGTVALLLEAGAEVHPQFSEKVSPLHCAYGALSRSKRSGASGLEVAALLIEKGADVDARDWFEQTPLHWACAHGVPQVAALLLEHGACIESRDADDCTPLHIAAAEGRPSTMELLLERGANMEARDEWLQKTPLNIVAQETPRSMTRKAKILLKMGADIETREAFGRTPLHCAAGWGGAGTARLLLRWGADPKAIDNSENTPLHYAVQAFRSESAGVRMAEELLQRGAEVDAPGDEGRTPLHEAAICPNGSMLEHLIYRGADVQARDADGWTALDHAQDGGNSSVAEYLIARIAVSA